MDNEKKYAIVSGDKQQINGITVYRIRALRDIYPTRSDCHKIKKGALGGYIQTENNLDHLGECWIHDGSIAMHQSVVRDNAQVIGYSLILYDTVIEDDVRVSNSTLERGCRVSHKVVVDNSQLRFHVWLFDDVNITNIKTSTPALYGRQYRYQRVHQFVESIMVACDNYLPIHEAQKAVTTLIMKWVKGQASSSNRNNYELTRILDFIYFNAAELMQGRAIPELSLAQSIAMQEVLPSDFDQLIGWLLYDPKELIETNSRFPITMTDALVAHYLNHPSCLQGERLKIWHEQMFHHIPTAYIESSYTISHTLMAHYLTDFLIKGRRKRVRALSIDFSDTEKSLVESGDLMPVICRLPNFLTSNPHWLKVAHEVLISTQDNVSLKPFNEPNNVVNVPITLEEQLASLSLQDVLAPLRGTDKAPTYRVTGHNSTGQKRSKLEL